MQARRITVLALLAGLTLAGCGEDEPAPKVEPPASSTPTPSPTAPVEPTLPPEAEGTSKAAAEGVVAYYLEAVNYAQQTGDTSPLETVGDSVCEACASGLAFIREVYESGGNIDGGDNTVVSLRSDRLGKKPLYNTRVEVVTDVTPQQVNRNGAGEDETYSASRQTIIFSLVRERDAWTILSWKVV